MPTRTTTVAAVLLVTGLALTACNNDGAGVNTSADHTTPPALATVTHPPKATTSPTPTKPKPAHVGDTITVHGMDDGSKLAVTIIKWVDPAKGADEWTAPGKGKRFVAAQVRVTNVGTAVYDDTPGNGMQVADSQGQRFDSTYGDVSAGPSMPSEVKLRTGDKVLGYITFEVPKTSKIVSIQFTPDSGFADETAQWDID